MGNVIKFGCESKSKLIVKKALLVGINYTSTGSQLSGCINDTENLKQFLLKIKAFW